MLEEMGRLAEVVEKEIEEEHQGETEEISPMQVAGRPTKFAARIAGDRIPEIF